MSEELIKENKKEQAEQILDLSLKKMPIEYFGFYSLLEPYISTYYKLERFKKGDDLFITLSKKYEQNLSYYSNLSFNRNSNFSIYTFAEKIITDTERYRSLIESALNSNDKNFKSNAIENFIIKTEFVKEIYGNYDYYTLLIPFLEDFYKYGPPNMSKELYINISSEIKKRLEIFNTMESSNQLNYIENIANNLYEFRNILSVIESYEIDKKLINSEIEFYFDIRKKLIK